MKMERTMDDRIQQALEHGRTIDITTIGRKSGRPRRIEIWYHNVDGRIYITGTPGRRDWYANLLTNPEFTFHLKEGVTADLPARATPIEDENMRLLVFEKILKSLDRRRDLERWLAGSPLVEVELLA
jgi:deazaflavin-dependent oxidoreductase (nitroreductase family)